LVNSTGQSRMCTICSAEPRRPSQLPLFALRAGVVKADSPRQRGERSESLDDAEHSAMLTDVMAEAGETPAQLWCVWIGLRICAGSVTRMHVPMHMTNGADLTDVCASDRDTDTGA
jgi:hypothetical protein